MQWISVKEKLPETTENVLVCNFMEYAGCCDSFTVAYFNKKGWHPVVDMLVASNYDGGAVIQMDEEVTHWQPLPPPPSSHNSDYKQCDFCHNTKILCSGAGKCDYDGSECNKTDNCGEYTPALCKYCKTSSNSDYAKCCQASKWFKDHNINVIVCPVCGNTIA